MHMPPGSAFTASSMGGPEHRHWSLDTHLLASAVEALIAANWQRAGGKGKRPKPLKRPQSKSKRAGVKLASLRPPKVSKP